MKHLTRFLVIAILMALLAGLALSQSWSKADFSSRTAGGFTGILPATLTQVVSQTIYVQAIVLNNNSSSAVTVRVRDASTNCAGAACVLVPDDMTIAAKTQYSMPMYGAPANGGVSWLASDASNVTGRIVGTY